MAATLEGCIIALTGKFEDTHANIAASIKANGGKHSTKVVHGVTHLVASAADVEKNSAKVQQAAGVSDLKIVSIEWLTNSTNNHSKASEATFSVTKALINPASKGKKRARSITPAQIPTTDGDVPMTKKPKDGNKAKSKSLRIPLDETCSLGAYRVFIDDDGTIYDAALNQTNSRANSNKFYRIQLLVSPFGDYKTWTRWGRVGEYGANAILGDGNLGNALTVFNSKFKDKSGLGWEQRFDPTPTHTKKPKYTFIERKYEEDSSDDEGKTVRAPKSRTATMSPVKRAESSLPKSVQRLMELIFNQHFFAETMTEMNYDANKLPLGQLSKRTLQHGLEALRDLGELLADPALAFEKHNSTFVQAVEAISDSYYTIIPHSFGRQRPPIITTNEALQREVTLLESLGDMEIATTIMKDGQGDTGMHALDRQFAGLGLQEMTPLNTLSEEFTLLEEYLVKSHGSTHAIQFRVQDIFRIERSGEEDRFIKVEKSNRRLLWHGSRTTNYGGILSQGLRIAPPEAPVSGYAFGKGVYLADISSKSANYCHSNTSGNTGLLLLCEVELGNPVLEMEFGGDPSAAEMAKERGCIATWGKGATGPRGWKDASCVHENLSGVIMPDTQREPGPTKYTSSYLQYNEYIVYDVAQVKLRYLLRVEMN